MNEEGWKKMNTEDMKLEFILERLYCFYIVKAKAALCDEIKKVYWHRAVVSKTLPRGVSTLDIDIPEKNEK